MNLKVNEVAKLTGVTVRTLHYYDEIGLLHPGNESESGYRLYDENNLEVLQQILFFRELDFPLNEIKEIINNPYFNKSEALHKHRELLMKKRKRLDRLIKLTDQIMEGENKMSFKEFDMKEIEETKEKYGKEAKERWGKTDAYAESERRTASYGKEEWAVIDKEVKEIFAAFADLADKNKSPDCTQAQETVKRWQDCITNNFYPCSNEILQSLGSMYIADERFTNNLDKFGEGTAEFMAKAIEFYCKR